MFLKGSNWTGWMDRHQKVVPKRWGTKVKALALVLVFTLSSLHVGNFTSETAFLKIHNILSWKDDGRVTAWTLLNLSAAFNTTDCTILLSRPDDWFEFTRKALDWFKLYLTGRCQRIKLGNYLSSKSDVPFWSPFKVSSRFSASYPVCHSTQ